MQTLRVPTSITEQEEVQVEVTRLLVECYFDIVRANLQVQRPHRPPPCSSLCMPVGAAISALSSPWACAAHPRQPAHHRLASVQDAVPKALMHFLVLKVQRGLQQTPHKDNVQVMPCPASAHSAHGTDQSLLLAAVRFARMSMQLAHQ